ncbi:MAG: hypothetical protein ACYTXA_30635 [Nostoc sp.]
MTRLRRERYFSTRGCANDNAQYKSVERCPPDKSSPKIGIWVLLNINLNPDSKTLWIYLHTPLDILTIALSCHQ